MGDSLIDALFLWIRYCSCRRSEVASPHYCRRHVTAAAAALETTTTTAADSRCHRLAKCTAAVTRLLNKQQQTAETLVGAV